MVRFIIVYSLFYLYYEFTDSWTSGGGVIKSVISYTQFANKLRMAVKAHAAGINKIHALRSNRHHMD